MRVKQVPWMEPNLEKALGLVLRAKASLVVSKRGHMWQWVLGIAEHYDMRDGEADRLAKIKHEEEVNE